MKAVLFKMTIGLGIMVLATQQLMAQSRNCAPREGVIERLTQTYGEKRQSIGLVGQDTMMEMFASTRTGSWTITVTLPDGMTCLVASGQGYKPIADAPKPNV